MFYLILKDFKLISKKSIVIIAFALFIAAFFQKVMSPGSAYMFSIFIISYGISMYPMGYNDRYKADVIFNSLPVKRTEIVISRYLTNMLFIVLGFLIIFAGMLILKAFGLSIIQRYPVFSDFTSAFIVNGVFNSITLPLNFKYGAKGSGLISQLVFLTFLLGPNLLVSYVKNHRDSTSANKIINLIINGPENTNITVFLTAIVIMLISLLIAIRFYSKREF